MKRIFLLLIIITASIIPQLLFAEIDTLWTRKYLASEGATFFAVIETEDGAYLAGGCASYYAGWYFSKVDSDGENILEKFYWEPGIGSVRTLKNISNNNIFAAGIVGSAYYEDIGIAMLNANVDTIWTYVYGDTSTFQDCFGADITSDGGFIMAGDTNYGRSLVYDIIILKADSLGNMEWVKTYGGDGDEIGRSVVQTNNGGYLVVGYGDYASMLLVDSLGNEITHINDGNEYYSVTKSIDGDYVAAGAKWHGEYFTMYIAKVDSLLNIKQWKEYGNSGDWTTGYSIDNTNDGGYIIGGVTGNWFYEDGYVLKVDADLEKQWDMTFDVPNTEVRIFSAHETSDGNYIAAGDNGDYAWLLKLGEVQDVVSGDSTNIPNNYITLTSYPNPFNTSTEIKYYLPDEMEVKLEIFNLLGRRVNTLFAGMQPAGYHSIDWKAKNQPSGIYFCRLLSGGGESKVIRMTLLK